MKAEWDYVLLVLLCIFGTFYVIGTFFGNFNNEIVSVIGSSTDLWANLFASMIAIVFIGKVIKRASLEKNQQSITFVRGRVASILENLITSVKVPSDWKNKLADPKFIWEDYYKKLHDSRNISLKELETILDRYNYLLDSELMNDIFGIVNVLRSYYDYHFKFPARGYWNLVDAAQFSGLFISESKKILEKYNLLKDMGTNISFEKGEPPQISSGRIGTSEQQVYNYYSALLEETILFRDECREKYGKLTET